MNWLASSFRSPNRCYVNRLWPASQPARKTFQLVQGAGHAAQGVVDVLGRRLVLVEVPVEGVGHLVPAVDIAVPVSTLNRLATQDRRRCLLWSRPHIICYGTEMMSPRVYGASTK